MGRGFLAAFRFRFSNVPTERLEEIPSKLQEILKSIAEGNSAEAFDLQRMRNEVKRRITKTLNMFEDDPHEHIAGEVSSDCHVT